MKQRENTDKNHPPCRSRNKRYVRAITWYCHHRAESRCSSFFTPHPLYLSSFHQNDCVRLHGSFCAISLFEFRSPLNNYSIFNEMLRPKANERDREREKKQNEDDEKIELCVFTSLFILFPQCTDRPNKRKIHKMWFSLCVGPSLSLSLILSRVFDFLVRIVCNK